MTNSVPKSANRIDNPVKRRRFRLPRASTWFALLVAFQGLLQLALGVGRLVAPDVVLIRNDSGDEVSGLVRILSGILLIVLGKGLLERRRRAWIAALILLVAVLATNMHHWLGGQGIYPLAFILLIIGALLAFHRTFSVRTARRISYGQVAAAIAVALAMAYGIGGSYLLRDQFHGIDGWTDAAYFALIAYSTLRRRCRRAARPAGCSRPACAGSTWW